MKRLVLLGSALAPLRVRAGRRFACRFVERSAGSVQADCRATVPPRGLRRPTRNVTYVALAWRKSLAVVGMLGP